MSSHQLSCHSLEVNCGAKWIVDTQYVHSLCLFICLFAHIYIAPLYVRRGIVASATYVLHVPLTLGIGFSTLTVPNYKAIGLLPISNSAAFFVVVISACLRFCFVFHLSFLFFLCLDVPLSFSLPWLSFSLSIYVSLAQSICLYVAVSLSLSFCLFPSMSPSPYLCVCFYASISLSLSVSVSLTLSFSLSVYLSVSLSVSVSLNMWCSVFLETKAIWATQKGLSFS